MKRGFKTTPPRMDAWSVVTIIASSLLLVAACTQIAPSVLPLPLLLGGSVQTAETAAQNAEGAPGVASTAEPIAVELTPPATARPFPILTGPTLLPAPTAELPTIRVERGVIAQTVQVNGRVSGTEENPVAFPGRAVPAKIDVAPGDRVQAGQVLVETDAAQAQQALQSAQDQLDAANARLDQARQAALARQQLASATQQDAVATAQENLRQALVSQAAVQAGASDQDKQAADAAVVNAQAELTKDQAALDALMQTASPGDIQSAQDAVANAQLVLRQAQSDAARVSAGADPAELRTAQRNVADAQTQEATAQSALDQLTGGPDQFQLRAAQRKVDAAQAALNAAKGSAEATQDSIALANAQDELAKLKQPPSPVAITAARTKLDDAKATLATAQDTLNQLQAGPSQLAMDKANAAVASAQLTLQAAQAKLQTLQSGHSDDEIKAAQAAVDAAKLQLGSTQARRDAIYGHPTQDELATAQKRVDFAQRALDRARQGAQLQDDQSLAGMDVQKLQQQVAQLQANLDATQLRSPSAGQVVAVLAQPGQTLDAGSPALVLAAPGPAIVRVTLAGADSSAAAPVSATPLPPIDVGQHASVRVDGASGRQYTATVADVVDGTAPNTRTALIDVDWHSDQPIYGATASVQVVVQSKPDALVVPASAVKTAGTQKYVEFMDGATRRALPVKIGISTDSSIEILDGLSEGQVILAGGGPSAGPTPPSAEKLPGGTPAPTSAGPTAVPIGHATAAPR